MLAFRGAIIRLYSRILKFEFPEDTGQEQLRTIIVV